MTQEDHIESFKQLVEKWQQGDDEARDRLVSIVHSEVENIASSILRRNLDYRSIVTSELANEAFLKLFVSEDIRINNRSHLLALCARIMRFIVVDKIRHNFAQKNQGQMVTLTTESGVEQSEELSALALNAALTKLNDIDPDRMKIVEMRYFGGMTYEEIAEVMEVSTSTIKRSWRTTRAWLKETLVDIDDV
jgi:RNA polymerase sigma factor (TIGR02999 family)